MLKTVNPAHQLMNFFAEFNIGSFDGENEMFTYDQDYAAEKLNRFGVRQEIHIMMNPIYEKENVIQEVMNMTNEEAIERVRCEIKSYIIAAGYTQKEAVEACAMEFEKWSPSDSNFSNKLEKGTLRYLQAKQLAEILGYEIVWRRRRDD